MSNRESDPTAEREPADTPVPPPPSSWQRYRDLVRRRTADDVADELAFHVDMRVDEARRAGLSEERARQDAMARFGAYHQVESDVLAIDRARERKVRRADWLASVYQDTLFAFRSLRRAPSFALAAIATLALAIGANTAIFSLVDALLLQPLPYGEPARLVTLTNAFSFTGEFVQLRPALRSLTDLAAYRGANADFDGADDGAAAERLDGAVVSPNLFSVLKTPPALGRTFNADESDRERTNVVILSDGLWRRRFGGSAAAIGRSVSIAGRSTLVVGVMPPGFDFPRAGTDYWQPMLIDRGNVVSLWTVGGTRLVGRLRPGTTLDAARRELAPIARSMRHANPMWDPGPDYGRRADIISLQNSLIGGTRPLLELLLGCVLLVLIVACVNVANLLLARASARDAELAVRAALGGGRRRLVRQLITESIVLAAVGGCAGVVIAAVGLRWLVASLPADLPRLSEIHLSATTLGFTALLTVLTGVAFGLLPALRATSGASGAAVVRAGRAGRGGGHQRLSSFLIVGEVALAVLLAIGAELLVRSFSDLKRLDPGFRASQVVTARVTPAPALYADVARENALYDAILARAAALPGVERAAAVSQLPIARPVYGGAYRIEGQFEDIKHGLPTADHSETVTPGYFDVLRIPIVKGRGFSDDDRGGAQPVAIVSRSMARHFWPAGDAIGKRIGYPWESPWLTIVGIAADVRADSLRDTAAMAVYLPFRQRARPGAAELTLVLRTSGEPSTVVRQLRAIVAGVDRGVPVSEVRTMDDVIARSLTKPRFVTTLVGAFALVALLLGAVGIYGVMSYVVSQDMRAMGIRLALGATTGQVRGMVVTRAARLAGLGALLGVAAATVGVRPLRAFLVGVSAADPVTYLTVPVIFLLVALVASYLPARRATRADPATVLKAT